MSAPLAPCEYKTGRVLGAGSYATVKEAVHIKTGLKYAVKVISKKLMAGREHLILNEIHVLQKISRGHPHIITLVDFFETPSNLYLVQDLCLGGELFDALCERGSFTEQDAVGYVRIIVDATLYLHRNGIVHRDLKCENLLFREPGCKDLVIADFGLSKLVDKDASLDGLLTTYMAPEVILKRGYGTPVDMWSIGALTYFLLCGFTPFDMNRGNEEAELENVLAARFSFPGRTWAHVSEGAKDFIRALLVLEPRHRLSAEAALQHPWLQPPAPPATGGKGSGRGPPGPGRGLGSPSQVDFLPNVREGYAKRRTTVARAGSALVGGNPPSAPLGASHPSEGESVDAQGHLLVMAPPP